MQSLHSVGVVTISFITSCYALSCLVPSICIIAWFFAFLFFFLILHGVCVVGIMGFVWWGVLFFCLCTTTFLCIPYGPYNVYSYLFSVMFCMPISSFTCAPSFFFFSSCVYLSMLGCKFLGCVCICIICICICVWKYACLIYFVII